MALVFNIPKRDRLKYFLLLLLLALCGVLVKAVFLLSTGAVNKDTNVPWIPPPIQSSGNNISNILASKQVIAADSREPDTIKLASEAVARQPAINKTLSQLLDKSLSTKDKSNVDVKSEGNKLVKDVELEMNSIEEGIKQEEREDVGSDDLTEEQVSDSIKGFKEKKQRIPQALVIGVKKCGTATLKSFLALNEYIQPTVTEQHYFDRHYEEGESYYISQMVPAYDNQLTLEGSPRYFVDAATPERVAKMNSSMRLLVIVRNPVTRLISDFVHKRGLQVHINPNGHIKDNYGDLASHVFTAEGEVNLEYEPVRTSIYAMYLSRWLDWFPASQIHLVDGDRFVAEPWVELQAVEHFLGVTSMITQDNFVPHPSKNFYCKRKGEDEMKCMSDKRKGREHPPIPEDLFAKLKAFYRPYNEDFFELTGRRFNWN